MKLSQDIDASQSLRWYAVLLGVCVCLFAGPGYSQDPDSDYQKALETLKEASGSQSESTVQDAVPSGPQQPDRAIKLEFEAGLSVNYPEEFAIYKKLDPEKQAEVMAEYARYLDKPESMRYLKAINRIGLISGSTEWEM